MDDWIITLAAVTKRHVFLAIRHSVYNRPAHASRVEKVASTISGWITRRKTSLVNWNKTAVSRPTQWRITHFLKFVQTEMLQSMHNDPFYSVVLVVNHLNVPLTFASSARLMLRSGGRTPTDTTHRDPTWSDSQRGQIESKHWADTHIMLLVMTLCDFSRVAFDEFVDCQCHEWVNGWMNEFRPVSINLAATSQ